MIYQIVTSAEADDDVFGIACYLAEQREGLGFRFYACVDDTYRQIADNPLLKGLGHFRQAEIKNIRIRPVKDFPNHLIFYRIEADRIEILRVIHGARDYMSLFDAPSS